jgi:tRNA pseudouridine55 synthase
VSSSPAGPGAAGRPRWRELDGIVLLDKPPGMGSTPALQRVRRLLRAAKAGHAGTLDPMATGMLPLCFGQATKACGQLLGSAKAYRARLVLGAATDTADADGQVVRTGRLPDVDLARLEAVLASLSGNRDQLPPMYSALKRDGRPLYELARRGEEVERAPRRITIRRLEALSWQDGVIEFEVECSKGTYVRVLGEEIAAALGTVGHLGALRRLWVEPFSPDAMVTLETVEAWVAGASDDSDRPAWLLPVDAAFPSLPRLDLDALDALHLRQGRTLKLPFPAGGASHARVYDPTGRFLGLAEPAGDGGLRVARLFVAGASGEEPQTA